MDELSSREGVMLIVDVFTDVVDTVTVRIGGELDISNVDALDSEVARALAQGPARLIIDIGALLFADSSAIALWVRWAGSVDYFELRNPSTLVRRVLEAMGLVGKLKPPP
jgi:anti-anti-sigma factor